MKKLLLVLLISLKLTFSFSQSDCISNNVNQPCCNDLISTDPFNSNAHNPERTDLINTFNWLIPKPNNYQHYFIQNQPTGLVSNPLNTGQTKYQQISNSPLNLVAPFSMDTHIMHPRYGWELMLYNMNFEKFSTDPLQTGQPVSGPSLMFYNKYNGTLRYLFTQFQ